MAENEQTNIPDGPVASTPAAAALAASGAAFAEQDALAAAGRAKLAAMMPGGKLLPESKPAAAPPKPAEPSAARKEIDALNKPDSDLWSRDETKQRVAAQRLRQLLAEEEQASPEDAAMRADMSTSDLRDEFGLQAPDIKMPGLTWNEADERTFLHEAHASGWEPALVRDLMTDYVERVQMTRGEVTDDMVAEFHAKYRNRLSQKERDALVAWIRSSA